MALATGTSTAHESSVDNKRRPPASASVGKALATVTECDRLAGDPFDPMGPGAAVTAETVDPALAVSACEKEARKTPSSARTQYQLSRAYSMAENPTRSLATLRKASDLGHPAAQALLAELYLEGEEVPQDDQQAARLFRSAAERGIGSAQMHLAGMYIDGRGVEQSDVTGLALLHQAADAGYADAQVLLGQLYLDGGVASVNDTLVAPDPGRARHYLRLAADQGHEEAAELLAAIPSPAAER